MSVKYDDTVNSYKKVMNLVVVNDSCERALGLLTEFNTGFEINARPKKAEIASGKLYFRLTCPTDKLTKYSVLNNIKQNYLGMQFRCAFVAIK